MSSRDLVDVAGDTESDCGEGAPVNLAPSNAVLLIHYRMQLALIRYDELTGGDIRHDAEARPVVAGELAAMLQINFAAAAELLANALARRAANKQR